MWDTSHTFAQLESSGVDTVVLPVGAIEQHGRHLPISVDWVQADALGRGVAQGLSALLLPALPFGNSEAHAGFRGSISIQPQTLSTLVTDIVESLFDQGFKRIVVLNTHGGNLVLKLAVRALNMRRSPGRVLLVFPPQLAAGRLSEIFDNLEDELHAGDLETSVMLHLCPDQVGPDRVSIQVQGHRGLGFAGVGGAARIVGISPGGHEIRVGLGQIPPARHRHPGVSFQHHSTNGQFEGILIRAVTVEHDDAFESVVDKAFQDVHYVTDEGLVVHGDSAREVHHMCRVAVRHRRHHQEAIR